jgi:hypothetical protein
MESLICHAIWGNATAGWRSAVKISPLADAACREPLLVILGRACIAYTLHNFSFDKM